MNRKLLPIFLMISLIVAGGWLVGQTFAGTQANQPAMSTAVGSGFTYQGKLNDGGVPANGLYDFQFGLYDAPDNGSQIGITLTQMITVTNGLFTTSLDFGDEAFNGNGRYLEIAVQFSGGGYTTLTPRQALTAVPYASYADKVQPVENVVTVAKSGGDYTTVSAALAAITSASASNPYLIRIAPGVYTENDGIDLKSYVSVEGSGQGVTIIRGDGSPDLPFASGTAATVRAGNIIAELRHLTVESITTDFVAIAIRTENATTSFQISHVTATGSGATGQATGVFNTNSSPTMEHIMATSVAVADNSFAIYNHFNANPFMRHIVAESSGGTTSSGIRNQSNASPIMIDVTATGDRYGLETLSDSLAAVTIRDSRFTGSEYSLYRTGGTITETVVSGSIMDGPLSNTYTCLQSQNSEGQPLDSDCQAIISGDVVTWEDVANVPPDLADGDDTGSDRANIVWVAKSGGDFTGVQAALDSITDATAMNPYVIKVAPGIYTETTGITITAYIDIEGSGEGVTILRSFGGASLSMNSATLRSNGALNSEVRSLTVESKATGADIAVAIYTLSATPTLRFTNITASATGGEESYGIFNYISSSPMMSHVTASATAASSFNYAVSNASDSSPTMNHVTAFASGGLQSYGINNSFSSPIMSHVNASASAATDFNMGIYNISSSMPVIRDSQMAGALNSIRNDSSSNAQISNSILDGAVTAGNGISCFDSQNGAGQALDTSCLAIGAGAAVTWNDVANVPDLGLNPSNVVWVAKSGGDYTSVQDALDNITDETALNPYVIKVAPGIYDGTVEMKAYVDIEGSGAGVTLLRGFGSDTWPGTDDSSATVRATGNITAELRLLTIESDGTGKDYATAIHTTGVLSGSLKLTQVTATASGGTDNYGLWNDASSPLLSSVSVTALGGANSYGVTNISSSSITIRDSALTGNTSILNDSLSSANVANTVLSGLFVSSRTTCLNSQNELGQALDTACQPITSGDAVTWNDVANAPNPLNVVWVAKSGGDYTSVQNALDNITASAANRYVIKVAPGIYTGTVDMEAYVDIEGSGQGVTILRGFGGNTGTITDTTNATLRATGIITAEVRFLTVESDGTGKNYAVAIRTTGVLSGFLKLPYLTQVTASATGSEVSSVGVHNVYFSSPNMNNVTASGAGRTAYGVINATFSSPNMNNVTATATATGTDTGDGIISAGVQNILASSPDMNNVTATATGELVSGVLNVISSSPNMNNVTATGTATGTGSSVGVNNNLASSPNMNNVAATAEGGILSVGVNNNQSSSPDMNNVTATATGTGTLVGVRNIESSSPDMNNVTATATGGTSNVGMISLSSSSPSIRNSALIGTSAIGTSASIVTDDGAGATANVALTMLAGPISNGNTCYGTYDASYNPVTCP